MSRNRITIQAGILTWARERAGLPAVMLQERFPKLMEWESGELKPTFKQLEDFANAVHIPIGYLFLAKPIQESLPISDFRTVSDNTVSPSPDLLDTLYLCQQRQDWYRDFARITALPVLDFIGSVTMKNDPVSVAKVISEILHVSAIEREHLPNWTETLRQLITRTEEAGIMVMASSIVGSNSHRKLAVNEFRGFSLADNLAPLIFLNAADSKAAQIFTLAHELVHLWLGESGVSNTEAGRLPEKNIERWCNAVAAELLVPLDIMCVAYMHIQPLQEEIQRLARQFKVSTLVILRRLFDAGFIDETMLWKSYNEEMNRIRALDRKDSGGGDFYNTLGVRTGKRFTLALLSSTLEGQTLFKDAFRMLGIKQTATFYNAAREFGVMI